MAAGSAAQSCRWSSSGGVAARWRATAAALVCALHIAVFVPTIGDWSSILINDFAPQAQAIKGGELPYRDQDIEYPPLSVPVLVAPIYLSDSTQGFVDGFMWEMLAFDLGIVVLITLALPGDAKRVLSAVGVYTAGVVILSGVVLSPSLIDTGPLALQRFDLVPALFVLAAVFARDRGRSAAWSGLLSIGGGHQGVSPVPLPGAHPGREERPAGDRRRGDTAPSLRGGGAGDRGRVRLRDHLPHATRAPGREPRRQPVRGRPRAGLLRHCGRDGPWRLRDPHIGRHCGTLGLGGPGRARLPLAGGRGLAIQGDEPRSW